MLEKSGVVSFGAQRRNVVSQAKLQESVQRGIDNSDMVVRSHRFGENVLHASRFEHRAYTTASDQSRTRRSWLEEDLTTVVLTKDIVRDRVALELHVDQMFVGVSRALLDRVRDFVRFAVADTDFTLAVTNDGESCETESSSAFDDLGAAIDEDDLLDHLRAVSLLFGVAIIAVISTWTATTTAAATTIGATVKLARLTRWSGRGSCRRSSVGSSRGGS